MKGTAVGSLRELRRRARERAEQRFAAELTGLRAAEDQARLCTARQAGHLAGRLAVATARLSTLELPPGRSPGQDSSVSRAQMHETRERLLRAEAVLLAFGCQRAAWQRARSVARVADAQACLLDAERRLGVVERLLATRAAAERGRRERRAEREGDDYSSSRNSSL